MLKQSWNVWKKMTLTKTLVLYHLIFLLALRRSICIWPRKLHDQIPSNNKTKQKKKPNHKTTTKKNAPNPTAY